MDEARAVLRRLDRIERLDRAGATAAVIIDELRWLVYEAEVWAQIEPASTARAEGAIERLRVAVDGAADALGASAGLC